MTTYTGLKVNPLNPDPDTICIRDIAHHLALECRYNGACLFHYSVAQHCVVGSYYVSLDSKLAFLLHDASEAYMHDLVKGLKDNISFYKEAEERLQKVIYKKFGVIDIDYAEIKRVDYALMAAEAKALISNTEGWSFPEPCLEVAITAWSCAMAEDLFMSNYEANRRIVSNVKLVNDC